MFHVQLENSFTNGGAWMTSTVTDYYHGMYSLSLMVTFTPAHVQTRAGATWQICSERINAGSYIGFGHTHECT